MALPRYFFDISDAGRLVRDERGRVLPDDRSARLIALFTLPDVDEGETIRSELRYFFVAVRDMYGVEIYRAESSVGG